MRAAAVMCVFGLAVLAGCASQSSALSGSKADKVNAAMGAASAVAGQKPGTSTASAVTTTTLISHDPLRIEFDAMSATLDQTAKSQIAFLVDQANSAKVIYIHGYCDRSKIANAKAAAEARANAVKKEFIAAGVSAKKFKTRVVTTEAQNVAVISFNQPK